MIAEICHTAGDFMAAGVSKTTFLMSFWCPGTHPETPGGQKGVQTGSRGGPASILDDFSSPFGSNANPQGTTFGVLVGIFLAFLSLFRRFLSRALFGVVFGWFRDLPDLENMAKPL